MASMPMSPGGHWFLCSVRRMQKGPSEDDVKDAIQVAREVSNAASKILDSGILSPW